MAKTTNLGLEITTSDSELFEDWRNFINGNNEYSMAKILDAFAGGIEQDITNLESDKLDKIWNDITSQSLTNLNDEFVLNRGGIVYKTTLANMLSNVVPVDIFVVVSVLPEVGQSNKIYLVPSSGPETQNVLDEFIWVDNDWEMIGNVGVDLSNYFNKTEINSMLGWKQDKLVAGDNITIDENTNVISASGGGGDGIDLNMLGYMNYAADIFYRARRQNLLASAWGHSLTVDTLEISATSSQSNKRGMAQYPNGATEGVIIPQGVTTIGTNAFYNWSANNQPLVIPNSITSIGYYAFGNWTSNNQPLVISNSVTNIGYYAFYNWTSNNQPLVIPNSITSIESYTFSNWTSNNQPLVIPNNIRNIGLAAFYDWTSNNQPLVISNSVTNIGNYAFNSWSANNQPLVIPNSVTSIGSYAFGNWTSVPYVEIQAITPPTLVDANAFDGQNDAPIYVPNESVDDYKAATNWADLASRIFSINDK